MREHFHNVQALRGLACLLVVVYHTAAIESLFGLAFQPLRSTRWFGYAGVDLFFVLSGFIIASTNGSNLGRSDQLAKYLFRRLWRIYPPFWVAFALTNILWACIALSLLQTCTPREVLESIALFPQDPIPRLMPVAWSLSYELMFYLAFALLFVLPRRIAVAVLAFWGVAVVSALAFDFKPVNRFAALPLSGYVLEFLGGVLIAWCPFRIGGKAAVGLTLAGLAWAAVTILAGDHPHPDHLAVLIPRRVLVYAPAFILLVFALTAWERNGGRIGWSWLETLGDASYSIYLIHASALAALFYLTMLVNWSHSRSWHVIWIAVMIASSLGAGLLMHRFVEKPLIGSGKRVTRFVAIFANGLRSLRKPKLTSSLSPAPRIL